MRILHIVRQFYPCVGGVEIYVLGLARQQLRQGHQVEVLTLDRNFKDGSRLPSRGIIEGIPIRRVPFWGSIKYPIALFPLSDLKPFDILHIHGLDFFVDCLVLTKWRHRKRIIYSTHGGFFHTRFLLWFKKFYFHCVTRFILKGCDAIIACSRQDQELFSRIARGVHLVENGVDVDSFLTIQKDIRPGVLLYIGRIDVHKRVDLLIRAVKTLRDHGHDVSLRVVGPDWKGLRPELTRLAEELGIKEKVVFLDVVSDADIQRELSQAHFFVSASEYEGFGISSVEAMASGTVCILNDIVAFHNLIQHDHSGYIVNFSKGDEVLGVISAALRLGSTEYSLWAERARARAKTYSWPQVAEVITKIY